MWRRTSVLEDSAINKRTRNASGVILSNKQSCHSTRILFLFNMFSTKDICLYLAILSTLWKENQSIHESRIILSNTNLRFSPGNYPGQILSTFIDENNLLMSCAKLSNQNTLCRIFDINGVLPNQCRLFQRDINLHGTIMSSSIDNYGDVCKKNHQ